MALQKDPVTGAIISVPDSTTESTPTNAFLAKDPDAINNIPNQTTLSTDNPMTDDGGLTPQMKALISQATEFNESLAGLLSESPIPGTEMEGDLPYLGIPHRTLDVGGMMKRIDIILKNNCSDSSSALRASREIREVLSEQE